MELKKVRTRIQSEQWCEGIINDFESGVSTKEETLQALSDYTYQIHDVFFEQAKKCVKKNPNFFEETSNRNREKLTPTIPKE